MAHAPTEQLTSFTSEGTTTMNRIFTRAALPIAGVAAAIVLAAGAASATVTYDPATGAGFVGKGDVQTVFVWNNAQLQSNAASVGFTYLAEDSYEFTCTWITGEGTKGQKTHTADHVRTSTVNSAIAYDPRTNKKSDITGFTLTGFGQTTESGFDPANPACPGEDGTGATITDGPTLVGSTGGLFVSAGALGPVRIG